MIRKLLFIAGLFFLLAAAGTAYAQPTASPTPQTSPIHPTFEFLDAKGQNVLTSGQPVSTMQTCGTCHDTTYIASHSFHADLGKDDFTPPGKWNPLVYRFMLPDPSVSGGLNTIDWVKANAARLVGGGLAEQANLEMDCFLCHFTAPNIAARTQAIQTDNFQWANTASLVGTGLVETNGNTFSWVKSAFSADGKLLPKTITIQDPTNENCAQCHGLVQMSPNPLILTGCDLSQWQTATTGQVIASQKISNSGMNLAEKDSLTRPFDIHAERGLKCTDCHYSLNNPAYHQAANNPSKLQFDPRHLDIGDYLQKPDHNFARGQSAQNTIAPELKGTMRRCESCHNAQETHTWLPYESRHLDTLACEACHIPKLYAPAVQSYDWTALKADKQPLSTCRGVEGNTGSLNDSDFLNRLVTGFTPVLMPRQNIDGKVLLAPYNLITTWSWVAGADSSPVSKQNLEAAWFEKDQYAPQIVAVLDKDQNGTLSEAELILDTPKKQAVIAGRLAALGLKDPHIAGVIQPYSVNHSVAGSGRFSQTGWAIQDCSTCHGADSQISQPMKLADNLPGGVQPKFVNDSNTIASGSLYTENGALYYRPATQDQQLYVFGHDRVPWVDWFGAVFFVAVLGGVSVHGGLRFYTALKTPRSKSELAKVYMYAVYERFWHWLQTIAIVTLLFTGLIIHRPDIFGIFSFPYVVVVHNVLAALLVINAVMSLFYHLVSGEIRQFIPRPYGFLDDAILQAKYYLQGIFKGGEHPFEKVPQKKLNPLQQVTYFGILNVLLPLQIVTGALMWGVQQWPQTTGLSSQTGWFSPTMWFGGLPFLAPFHSFIAWTFAAFIVGHVYLTTTGHQPLTAIQAMVTGWENVEIHPAKTSEVEMPGAGDKPALQSAESSAD